VAYRGELDFGLRDDPGRGLATLDEFKQRWQAGAAGYALVPHATAAALARDGVAMRVLAQDFDNVLVSRR